MDSAADQNTASKRATAADQAALEALEFDWGDAYLIGQDGKDGWQARRRDQIGTRLTAPGPDELRAAIRADYELKPVPRDLGAGDGEP